VHERQTALGREDVRGRFAAVGTLVDRCLALEPTERPSMADLEEALESLRVWLISTPEEPKPARSRSKRLVGTVIGTAAVVLAVSAFFVIKKRAEVPTVPVVSAVPVETVTPSATVPAATSSAPSATATASAAPPVTASSIHGGDGVPRTDAKLHERRAVKAASATASASNAPAIGANAAPILR
jgi:hypothetical protein